MTNTLKRIILFLIFGAIYCILEMIWRGRTYISMAMIGGIAGVVIGEFNEKAPAPFLSQCFAGMSVITLLEGISGLILNVWLKLGIWDYSNMPGQFFWGQCCIPYCILWFILAGVAVYLDDWLRWLLFNE